MPWGRVDDHHYRHEKVGELHEDLRKGCLALFWLAISWCNDRLTDGRVPTGTVRVLGGDTAEADELVRVGLWEKAEGGYRIHDYLDFNKSKAQVLEERAQRVLAGRAGAAARWRPASEVPSDLPSEPPSDVPSEMHGGKDAPVTRYPLPVTPLPAPDARDGLPHIDAEARAFIEGMTGRSISTAGQKQLTEYDRQIEDHGLKAVMLAYQRAARTLPQTPKPTARQLVWSAMKILEPLASAKDTERHEREEEIASTAQRRRDNTQRYLRELRGEAS